MLINIPNHNKGSVILSGRYLVSKSITLKTIRDHVKHIAKKACNDTPKIKAVKHAKTALVSSIIGYLGEISFLQFLHFPFNSK